MMIRETLQVHSGERCCSSTKCFSSSGDYGDDVSVDPHNDDDESVLFQLPWSSLFALSDRVGRTLCPYKTAIHDDDDDDGND